MDRRLLAALALSAVLLLAGCSIGYQDPHGEREPPGADGDEHLGYYDGYWYNETLDVEPADGLTHAEQRAVFSRSMARIQYLRGLEFEDRVDVELVTRQEFRDDFGDVTGPETGDGVRALDNAQHEALFLVGPDEDVVATRGANRGDVVLGFYDPRQERIVVVSGNDPATLDDEITLAHELVHALQDQQFGLSEVEGRTLDGVNARNGLVEGDAVAVEQAYERNCETGRWQCVEVSGGHEQQPPGENFHIGVYFVSFFPYAEGPSFVRHHRDRGGWAAVDDVYDAKPTAAAEIVHPETYATGAYGEATVRDRNTGEWERVRADGGVNHSTVGQSGLSSMFAYTAFEGNRDGVIAPDEFRNLDDDGRLDRERPFTYDVGYADGWYADRLHAYRGDDGEIAYVWNVTFRDEANATEFVEGYERVAGYWDGERVGERSGGTVWRFDAEPEPFRGAVWVARDGNAVTVVRAPTARDLGDVYAPSGR